MLQRGVCLLLPAALLFQIQITAYGHDRTKAVDACPEGARMAYEGLKNGCQKLVDGIPVRVGAWLFFTHDGKKREERSYWNGVLHGLRKRWDTDGRPAGVECFVAGERRDTDECTHIEVSGKHSGSRGIASSSRAPEARN